MASPPSIFISHSSLDRDFIETEIIPLLQRHGLTCWYSPQDIQSSAKWERVILQGLKDSDWFMLIMSPRSAKSDWVQHEVNWWVDHIKQNTEPRIVPVLIEEVDPYDFHISVGRLQYVDYDAMERDESRRRLLGIWGQTLKPDPAPTTRQPRSASDAEATAGRSKIVGSRSAAQPTRPTTSRPALPPERRKPQRREASPASGEPKRTTATEPSNLRPQNLTSPTGASPFSVPRTLSWSAWLTLGLILADVVALLVITVMAAGPPD